MLVGRKGIVSLQYKFHQCAKHIKAMFDNYLCFLFSKYVVFMVSLLLLLLLLL